MKYCPNPECPGQPEPGVRPEFVDSMQVCTDCGTPLVSEPAERTDESDTETAGWVVVHRFGNRAEALAASSALQAVGIFPEVLSENPVSDTILPASSASSYALLVQDAAAEQATDILESPDATVVATDPDPDRPDES